MKQTTLRLPEDLYAQVERQAEADRRSVNAEMVWLLESGLASPAPRLMDMTAFPPSGGLPRGWVWWRCNYCDMGRVFPGTVREEAAEARAHQAICPLNPRPVVA